MQEIQRRALYNLLRLNWVSDTSIAAQPWQVEDYRKMSFDLLLDRLREKGFYLDKTSFLALADSVDTPEDFTDELMDDSSANAEEQDQVYLLVFELWRRLKTEKPCLSVFCDELDYQIHLYDLGVNEGYESIQDSLANLQVILDENTDQGVNPNEAFKIVSEGCANDIEAFLYDFISEQIDNHNESYASELIDAFYGYVSKVKPFDFLRARIMAVSDADAANKLVRQIVQSDKSPNLDFYFDLLAFMIQNGEEDLFQFIVKKIVPLLQTEEDFHDLLAICADFYHCLDREKVEQDILELQKQRSSLPEDASFGPKDPAAIKLLKILTQ